MFKRSVKRKEYGLIKEKEVYGGWIHAIVIVPKYMDNNETRKFFRKWTEMIPRCHIRIYNDNIREKI